MALPRVDLPEPDSPHHTNGAATLQGEAHAIHRLDDMRGAAKEPVFTG